MKNAKDKCEILKEIRKYVAEKYGLDYEPTECNHKGDCKGTCPKCEAELTDLQVQLQAKGITDITSDENLCALIKQYAEESQEEISESSTSDIEPMHTIGMPEIEGMEYFIPNDHDVRNAPWGEMLLECRIAGTTYHHVDDILDNISEGDEVFLIRDFQNKHDDRAVAVTLENPYLNKQHEFDFSNIFISQRRRMKPWQLYLTWDGITSLLVKLRRFIQKVTTRSYVSRSLFVKKTK